MARRGGAATQSFLPVAAIIAVLLFLGVVVLLVRSGHNPSGPSLGVSSPAPSPSSPSAPGGGSATPSTAPSTPIPGTTAPLPGGAGPSAGAVGPPAGVTPPAGPVTPSAGATTPAGGVPPQAAGPGSMPNTGPPFPWWMGLVPVSLGIGLMRALRRRPEPMGAGAGGRLVVPARDRQQASRPRGRPASGLGRKRP